MTKFVLRDVDPKDERPIELWLERDEDGSIKLMASRSKRDPDPHHVVMITPDGDILVSLIYCRSGVNSRLQ